VVVPPNRNAVAEEFEVVAVKLPLKSEFPFTSKILEVSTVEVAPTPIRIGWVVSFSIIVLLVVVENGPPPDPPPAVIVQSVLDEPELSTQVIPVPMKLIVVLWVSAEPSSCTVAYPDPPPPPTQVPFTKRHPDVRVIPFANVDVAFAPETVRTVPTL